MTHLDAELQQLRESIMEAMLLAKSQLEKSKTAFLKKDEELAEDIIFHEKKMNALELSIDRDCENIFALFNPVATDLRFVVSMLKINSDLERIADYADGFAGYVLEMENPVNNAVIEATQSIQMFDIAIDMINDVYIAFERKNSSLARKVFFKDAKLNKINANSSKVISGFVKEDPDSFRTLLFLYSTIRSLERVGDHVKNIAENLVFYQDAEILKHVKKI